MGIANEFMTKLNALVQYIYLLHRYACWRTLLPAYLIHTISQGPNSMTCITSLSIGQLALAS